MHRKHIEGAPLPSHAPKHSFADALDRLLAEIPLRAGGFIVTLYGDVVVPRGNEVWIGNIIETCAEVGISETLVRTAVSRLVAAGQLQGARKGRRGYYRLSESAQAEFAAAARVIYGEETRAGWQFVHLPEALAEAAFGQLERQGFARISGQFMAGPAMASLPSGALSFAALPQAGGRALQDFAARYWNLEDHATAYAAFHRWFQPLEYLLAQGVGASDADALRARLLMVHAFRHVALKDPRLPAEALPPDWPGHEARRLFARLYPVLSVGADSLVGRCFVTTSGPLARNSAETEARIALLCRT